MNANDGYDDDDDEAVLGDEVDADAWRDQPVTSAAEALEGFFLLERGRAAGTRLRRLDRAVADLRRCFDNLADRILTTGELAARDFERHVQPRDAALRVAAAYSWLFVLQLWLEDPEWWGDDLEDRRLRIALSLPFARYVARMPIEGEPNGWGCDFWSVEIAVHSARARLRQDRRRLAAAGA